MPYADKQKRRIHTAWKNMLGRCENKQHVSYKFYGGRGITVCEVWKTFQPFYEWAIANGYADNLTIDRINNNEGYSPSNCRWVTAKTNERNRNNNRRITLNGETRCVSDWAERLGISPQALTERLDSGAWTVEEALTFGKNGRPVKQPLFKKAVIQISKNGEFVQRWDSIGDAASALNIPASNISRALTKSFYTARGYCWRYAN